MDRRAQHTTTTLALAFAAALIALAASAAFPARTRDLTFEERVKAQEAIEQVYWQHRIWPKENPAAKPPLSAVMPESAIRAKVEDDLSKTAALDKYWNRRVTAMELRSEMERMAKATRSPGVLRELFAALHDDPDVIAECLARPALVDRLVRQYYASDGRIHAKARETAHRGVERSRTVAGMKAMGGEYSEVEVCREDGAGSGRRLSQSERRDDRLVLDAADWGRFVRRLEGAFATRVRPTRRGTPGALPVGRVSEVIEESDAFLVRAILSKTPDRIRVATVRWPKRSFDAWWRTAKAKPELADASPEAVTATAGALGGASAPAITGTSCPTSDRWSPTSQGAEPRPRESHTAVWSGAEMIVWGGYTDGGRVNTGARYDPATDTWVETSTGTGVPEARSNHTAVWTGTAMIVWGGETDATGNVNTGARYDPATDTWVETSTDVGAPEPRYGHTAVWTGTEMVVWGGAGDEGMKNDGGRYDPSTDAWADSSLATGSGERVPAARFLHTAVWTGTEMIVWGGLADDGMRNDGGRYSPSTDSWADSSLATGSGENVPAARYDHTAVWTGSEMIVWGGFGCEGESCQDYNSGGRYDPLSDSWVPTSEGTIGTPDERDGHTAVWTGSEMIVWGGYVASSETNNVTSTGGRYDPASDIWVSTSTGPDAPAPRAGQTAVWTGTEMIIWGGWGGEDLNTGGRYDPSQDSWTPTALEPEMYAPSARNAHTAVWTGAEMIVWGGNGNSGQQSSGGRYDPATDTWAPTSTEGEVPHARSGHTAVWTGTEMVIWGGANDATGELNTGGRYDPMTDSWLSTSTEGDVPSARFWHTSIWTGTEMIVWGGNSCDAADCYQLNSGAIYEPQSDSWRPMSVGTATPSARYLHTAVWTGTEMIVWGGISSTWPYSLDTGGRFDPVADTWVPTSTGDHVPAVRETHTAVWTGSDMIVWGGEGYSPSGGWERRNTGGRYNPVADAWAPTSTGVGVPDVRALHTAIWTGTAMIVWGGAGDSGELSSGGRYDPAADRWLPTSTGPHAPAARYGHTAVWTGGTDRLMIVWGGEPLTGTGGMYCTTCEAPVTWYRDADGDGHGSPATTAVGCEPPAGFVAAADDCDDARAAVYPGAPQLCDGANNDCGDPAWPVVPAGEGDGDADGFPACAECDDTQLAVYPGAPQICDGVNNDCMNPDWPSLGTTEADGDADGFAPCAGECNDGDPGAHPNAIEICDGLDNDCDGRIDDDPACDTTCDSPQALGRRPVSSEGGWPRLVWTGAEFGVVWPVYRHPDEIQEVRFARLDAAGNRIGDPVTISTSPLGPAGSGAGLAWTGTEFGVVWSDGRDGTTEIYFARVSALGVKLGAEVRVTDDATPSTDPNLVWNGSEYGMVWRDGGMVRFARIDTLGGMIGSEIVNTCSMAGCDATALVWNGSGYGVAWRDPFAGRRLFFGRLDAWGRKIGSDVDVPDTEVGIAFSPSLVWTGSEYGICWATGAPSGIFFRRLDATGDRVGSEVELDDGGSSYGPADIDWTGSRFGVTWVEGGAVKLAQLDSDGGRVGATITVQSSAASPVMRWTGSAHGVALLVGGGVSFTAVACNCTLDGDVDADGYGGRCDNCPDVFNPAQSDLDGDAYGDACDNCAQLSNPGQIDTDWDLLGDACDPDDDNDGVLDGSDHCPLVVDPAQSDVDADGRGDACDDCVNVANPDQADVDRDRFGDLCDSCPTVENVTQSDVDGDGEGDGCDLDDGVIYLATSRKDAMDWHHEQGFDSWNAYKGDLAVLKSTGVYTQAPGSNALAWRACGLITTSVDDLQSPAAGKVAVFLVTGMAGGVESGLGTRSGGSERPNDNPCP